MLLDEVRAEKADRRQVGSRRWPDSEIAQDGAGERPGQKLAELDTRIPSSGREGGLIGELYLGVRT